MFIRICVYINGLDVSICTSETAKKSTAEATAQPDSREPRSRDQGSWAVRFIPMPMPKTVCRKIA